MAEPAQMVEGRSGRRPRWLPWAIGFAVFAVAVGLVYAFLTVTRGNSASATLDRATQLIEEADTVVVSVDEVIGSQVESDLAPAMVAARTDVATASALLAEAVLLIDDVEPRLRGANARRGALLRESAEARQAMMLQAPAILDTGIKAAGALPVAAAAWSHVVEADRLSDKAVVAYNRLTGKGVRESRRLNKQAASELAKAQDGFAAAERAFPEAGFEAYLDYVAMRLELSRLSQSSDDAWLTGRLEQANVAITTYNDLDAKAVAAAKNLPASPAEAVAAAYSAIADAATDEYYAARRRATDADTRLRDR